MLVLYHPTNKLALKLNTIELFLNFICKNRPKIKPKKNKLMSACPLAMSLSAVLDKMMHI